MVSNGSPNAHPRAAPGQLDVALGAVLAAGAVGVGEVLGRPDEGEEAIGSERARGRRHVRSSLLPRLRRIVVVVVVVVGCRIRDVRTTGSSPEQDAEECCQ